MVRQIVIVGGGASGTLLATQLLRQGARRPASVTLVESGPSVGLGLAYGTTDEVHRLNVPAGRLVEQAVDPQGTGLHRRVLRTGGVHVFDTGHIHHVANERPEPAVSVHVYSPRLRTMTFYDHRPDSFLRPLRSEESP